MLVCEKLVDSKVAQNDLSVIHQILTSAVIFILSIPLHLVPQISNEDNTNPLQKWIRPRNHSVVLWIGHQICISADANLPLHRCLPSGNCKCIQHHFISRTGQWLKSFAAQPQRGHSDRSKWLQKAEHRPEHIHRTRFASKLSFNARMNIKLNTRASESLRRVVSAQVSFGKPACNLTSAKCAHSVRKYSPKYITYALLRSL